MKVFGYILIGLGLALFGYMFAINKVNEAHVAQEQVALRETLRKQAVHTDVHTETQTDDPTFSPETNDRTILASDPEPIPLQTPIGELRFTTTDQAEHEWVVVEGVGTEDLKLGPGHMPTTALPGDEGNAVISGHRTTYGGPFHDLHLLEVGSPISFFYPNGREAEFIVTEVLIVAPTDVWVIENREGSTLTLTTCNPIGSARERLVIFAEQT